MGFKSSQVEALDFDFTPHDGKGTVPEPSHDLRDAFLRSLDEATAGDGDLADRLEDVTVEDLHRLEGAYIAAIVELGQGTPSKEQLEGLPPRHQLSFMKYLVAELTDPTRVDTKP